MSIPQVVPRQFGPLFSLERARLLTLLRTLEPADWRRPSPCPGWDVLGLTAHLVGVDFYLVSSQRDDHRGTVAPAELDEAGFIAWLDDLQIEWVHAARRLSPRLVVELLDWTDDQVVEAVDAQDAAAQTARVAWASSDPVPVWLDQARELSERWIHRQQIMQALGRASDLRRDLAEPVLDGLRWAYPFRLDAHQRREGATVAIIVTGPEVNLRWELVDNGHGWQFHSALDGPLIAQLHMTTEQAWRLLSNNLDPTLHGAVHTSGDPEIVAVLQRTRAIIGSPK
jgi:uncharacterized protein (TIGR03083 family)